MDFNRSELRNMVRLADESDLVDFMDSLTVRNLDPRLIIFCEARDDGILFRKKNGALLLLLATITVHNVKFKFI